MFAVSDMADLVTLDRGLSPLASNNPFRKRITESSTSPALGPARPMPTNPFLDISELSSRGTGKLLPTVDNTAKQSAVVNHTANIFVRASCYVRRYSC